MTRIMLIIKLFALFALSSPYFFFHGICSIFPGEIRCACLGEWIKSSLEYGISA